MVEVQKSSESRWFDLFRGSRRYTPIVPDPTYARTLGGCAVRLRVSRSGRTLRSPRATQELHKTTIKGKQRSKYETGQVEDVYLNAG